MRNWRIRRKTKMDKKLLDYAQVLIDAALKEDLGELGDITTQAITTSVKTCRAEIIAKVEGVLAGLEIASRVFTTVSPDITLMLKKSDGEKVTQKEPLVALEGACNKILTAERTALNFLGHLSGIATLTRQFVAAVAGTKARILDTRKTTPGWRALEKYAVHCGGGVNHRMGLYDMVLVKDNHIIAAGGISSAVRQCREYLQKNNLKAIIEVEAKTLDEVEEALFLKIDRILLDNMTLELLRASVQLADGRIPLEASGNVTLANVRSVAETGIDYISIGALTHSAKVMDVSLEFLV